MKPSPEMSMTTSITDLDKYAPRPWRLREGTSVVEDVNGRDMLMIVARLKGGELEGKRAQAIAHHLLSNSAPQPAQDAGEWRLGASDKRCVFNATGNLVASTNSERDAAQICADHRSAAAVPKLVAALNNLLDKFYPHRCKPEGTDCEKCKALLMGSAVKREVEAMANFNQTGGKR